FFHLLVKDIIPKQERTFPTFYLNIKYFFRFTLPPSHMFRGGSPLERYDRFVEGYGFICRKSNISYRKND
ncbi:hypothetical protein CON64_11590, partial [Bacillus pseudomycoides]